MRSNIFFRRLIRQLRFILLLGLLALPCRWAAGQAVATSAADEARGRDVARIVEGIINFTHWPGMGGKLRLCVGGPSIYIDALAAETADSSWLGKIEQLPLRDARLASQCHVVYIEQAPESERDSVFQRFVGRPVLTIAGFEEGCLMGSLFCLSVAGARPAFAANLAAISRSGLHVNPKVLFFIRNKGRQ
jgi:hypothetical protein